MNSLDLLNIYKDKKVLITGHTGFKGSWLSLWLYKLGAEIIGISLPPKNEKDIFNLTKIKEKVKHYEQDIRNLTN
jgi:CDP-glucose 4,6-dehydratase